ncbi:FG-GAP and VCBS repeat-containing protein [Actinocorallia populi]|uniref:FG-GAP and VCBS repeat-containing protein n=1 Tax=Actinocorallia populi TaxID=2079200 RepID=UPI0018E4DE2F|nr:FG-GAP and VCBS repeat-containing protein [Actinocorallia populi]
MRSLVMAPLLVAGMLVVPGTAAQAAQCRGGSDFDGDGRRDLATGAPSAAAGGQARAGQVGILYGDGRQEWLVPADARRGGGFGAALAVGDLDGDRCADLAVGAPGTETVEVYLGAEGGLRRGPVLRLPSPGGDQFGTALVAADLDGDRDLELAAGAPGRRGGGAVAVFGLRADGLKGRKVFTASIGRKGRRKAQTDAFGAVLAAGNFDGRGRDELAVGLPGDGHRGEGSVTILDAVRSTGRNISQAGRLRGSPERNDGFGSALAAADFDADGRDDLAVGVPGEALTDKNRGFGEGAVHVLYGPSFKEEGPMWNRLTGGLAGNARRNDLFGAALAAGDLNGDGTADLAVGIPGSGSVQILRGRRRHGLTARKAELVTSGLGAAAHYGNALKIAGGVLTVGAPGDGGFTGGVYRSRTRLPLEGRGLTGFSFG